MSRRVLLPFALSLLLLLGGAVGPLAAQDGVTPPPGSVVAAVGPITLTDDEIRVNGYLIAPAGAFRPGSLENGEVVVITGVLLPDGLTIQADSIEFFNETDAGDEGRGQGNGNDRGNNGRGNGHSGSDSRPDNDGVDAAAADCDREDHPMGERLAETFGVPYAELMSWRCQTFGFGEISRAYVLAAATGEPVEAYFALRAAGVGWGVIMHEAEATLEAVPVPVIIPGRPLEFCPGNSCNAPGHNK